MRALALSFALPLSFTLAVAAAACGKVEVEPDATDVDAPAVDAPAVDAPAIDAPAIDAVPTDAAVDAPTQVTITVSKSGLGAAAATVTSNPAGIVCGSNCTGTFTVGTSVTLTTTVAGSVFNGWGGPCAGTGACTFTVGGATTVTASYRGAVVAIGVGPTSCLRTAGNSADLLRQRLVARGHTATFADATMLDTTSELATYDAIVFGGPGDPCAEIDAAAYDGLIDAYVRTTGRGIVGTGWLLYNSLTIPNIYANMPTVQNASYFSGTYTVTPSGTHPIAAGVGTFSTGQWLPYGGGTKPGATTLLTANGADVGAAWSNGNGRGVFLGPMFLENHAPYDNENLLDGTQASSIELMLRAVEWAARAR
ncbi:MAG: hypothetical protein HS111_28415 [Kofleriaceae bacterium]|nr:hypothetical protein [Kofleriaceae bacterium]MCL4223565.1 hypothetical protein [Myxococcales bacterium]